MDEKLGGDQRSSFPVRTSDGDDGSRKATRSDVMDETDSMSVFFRFPKAVIALAKYGGLFIGFVTFIIKVYLSVVDLAGKVYDQKSQLTTDQLNHLQEQVKEINTWKTGVDRYFGAPDYPEKPGKYSRGKQR